MTTAERTMPAMPSEIWDIWLSSCKAMNLSQDQMEALGSAWTEQARTMRHDGQKVFEALVTQTKANHDEFQRLAEQGVKSFLQHVPGWDALTLNDLRRQVADLNAKVEAVSNR